MSQEINELTKLSYALLNFAGKNDPRAYLNTIMLERKQFHVVLSAMNSSSLMTCKVKVEKDLNLPEEGKFLIPRDLLEQGKKTKASISGISEGRLTFSNGLSGLLNGAEGYPEVGVILGEAFKQDKLSVVSINIEQYANLAKFAKEAFESSSKSPTRMTVVQRGLEGATVHFGGKEHVVGLIMPLNDSISTGSNPLNKPDWI